MREHARIIVEGMDGSGKTTLVSQLHRMLDNENTLYVPGYNRVEGNKPHIAQWWMDEIANNPPGKTIVHDRFFYPEFVYGPILRGKIAADPAVVDYVSHFLEHFAFLIYCRPPTAVIQSSLGAEVQMPGVEEQFHVLLQQYDSVMDQQIIRYKGRYFKYDWTTDGSLMLLRDKIHDYLGGMLDEY